MNDVLERLHGTQRPEAAVLEQDALDDRVRPILKRRRIVTHLRRASEALAIVLCVFLADLFSPLLLVHLPQPILLMSAQLRSALPKPAPESMAQTIPFPLERQVEEADYFVQGRIEEVTFNKEDLAKQVPVITCPAPQDIRATVHLRVAASYPSLDAETVTFSTSVSVEGMKFLTRGGEYIVPLVQRDGGFLTPWRAPIYRIDPESGRIPGIYEYGQDLTVEEAWKIIRGVYDAVRAPEKVSVETINEWRNVLRTGTSDQCGAAIKYLQALPHVDLTPAEVVDAIERLYPPEANASVDEESKYLRMVQRASDLLMSIADKKSVERLFDLYVQDRLRQSPVFDIGYQAEEPLVGLFISLPGPERKDRIVKLLGKTKRVVNGPNWWEHEYVSDQNTVFSAMAVTPGEDIDALFLEITDDPAAFGLEYVDDLESLWMAMGRRGMAELRPTLNAALAKPDDVLIRLARPSNPAHVVEAANHALNELNRNLPDTQAGLELLIAQYNAGDTELIHEIRRRFPKDGRPYIDWLKMAPIREVADLIAQNAPDPSFVPLLTAALDAAAESPPNAQRESQDFGECVGRVLLLFALHECGAKEEAVRRLVELLEPAPTDGSPQATGGQQRWNLHQFRSRTELLKLAAYFADETAYSVAESYLDEAAMKLYYDMPATSGEFEGVSNAAAHLHVAAIVAAAKTGRERAIPVLQNQFRTVRLPLQLIAALALLYVGNHDGDAFLKSWVNHEEGYRTYLSILTYDWDDMPQTVPPESLLRSPQIDALYLDLLRQSEYFGFAPQLVVKCGLAEDHPNDVLPILVDLLSNRDSDLRSNADEGLRRLTGQDFGYNAQELVTQQSAAIAKWRAYVEEYLRTGGA